MRFKSSTMTFFFLLGTFANIQASPADNKSPASASEIEVCAQHYKSQVGRFERSLKLWLGDTKSSYNVFQKLSDLSALQNDYFKHFTRKLALDTKSDDTKILINRIKDLNSLQSDALNKTSVISVAEFELTLSLDNILTEVQSLHSNFDYLNGACNVERKSAESVKSELKNWFGEVEKIRTFINHSRIAREQITYSSIEYLKIKYRAQLNAKNQKGIADLLSTLEKAQQLETLVDQIHSINKKSIGANGDDLINKNLMYFKPLRAFMGFSADLRILESKVSDLGVQEAVANPILRQVRAIQSQVRETSEKLKSDGWQTMQNEQVAALQALEILDKKTSSVCRRKALSLRENLSKNSSAEVFASTEHLFGLLMGECHE